MHKKLITAYLKNELGSIYSNVFAENWEDGNFEDKMFISMFKPVFYNSILETIKDKLKEVLESGVLSHKAEHEVRSYFLDLTAFLNKQD